MKRELGEAYRLAVHVEVDLRVVWREHAVGGSDDWAGGHGCGCVCVCMCVVGEGYYIYVFVRCVVERCW